MQQWFNQETTGTAPAPREDFCSAGLNSTNGSYEIFVYGGYSGGPGDNPADCDTVNILTLPAFHWIVVPYAPLQNRHTHSCNAVGGSQIISIGGTQPTIDHLFSLSQEQYEYNDTDILAQGLAIFDMTKLQFVDQFTAGQPPYEQSRPIKDFYTRSQGGYRQNLVEGVAALMQISSSTAGKSLPSGFLNPTQTPQVSHPTSSVGTTSSTPTSSSLSPGSPPSSPFSHISTRAIAAGTIGPRISRYPSIHVPILHQAQKS
ncbi:hypothetical protein N7G274_010125 [Stereocaulon virgatum]|uniref:Uncharacterized protein n=1 Tax=Stereocaulon virgatum TaxID=373712 RepID=A0ABR3ZX83_9LECA